MKFGDGIAIFRMIGTAACALLFGSGCIFFPDTCNDGFNMTDPRVENGVESDATGLFVRIAWDEGTGTGGELPSSYFAAAVLEPFNEPDPLAESVDLTAARELTVRFDSGVTAQTFADANSTSFSLTFPDRRDFIDCMHPGSQDQYLLNVTLNFDDAGDIQTTLFEQRFIPGPI